MVANFSTLVADCEDKKVQPVATVALLHIVQEPRMLMVPSSC